MRRYLAPPSTPVWYSIVVLFLCGVFSIGFNIWYTNHVDESSRAEDVQLRQMSDRRWCNYLGTIREVYTRQPPQTETGKRIAVENDNLWRQFGCDKPPVPSDR